MSGPGQSREPDESTLAGQVARELAELTADLRDALDWERSGGALSWPATPRDERRLAELVIVAPASTPPGAGVAPPGSAAGPADRGQTADGIEPSVVGSRSPNADPAAAQPASREAPTRPPAPPAPPGAAPVDATDLPTLRAVLGDCRRCKLSGGRTHLVFGQGNPEADLMLIGEGPGYHEDRQGLAFVGPAGELLTKILAAIDLGRDDVYICNIVKCRPPKNRDPEDDEVAACRPFVLRQIELVRPRVILCLGRISGRTLLELPGASLSRMRGRVHDFRGTPLMVTYHPAALLRDASYKRPVWEDVQKVREMLDVG